MGQTGSFQNPCLFVPHRQGPGRFFCKLRECRIYKDRAKMEGLKLNCDKAEGAFDRIIEDYKVVAPKRIAGKGRFSDMDLVSYDMVESLSDTNCD